MRCFSRSFARSRFGAGGARRAAPFVLSALLAIASPVAAQTLDCNRLRAAIRTSESDAGQSDTGGFERASRQQRYEIERTRRYADQIGCDQSGLFGDGPPPECADIDSRLQRMQDNLDRMQSHADQQSAGDRANRQAALIARYNATCVGAPGNPADPAQDQVFGQDPDQSRNPPDLRTVPVDPDNLSTVPLNGDIVDDQGGQTRRSGQAICVRTCDGGYFPLSPRASQDQLDGLDQLCKASCPNTEAKLYTMGGSGGLASATAVDGTSYMDLPAAFKFEKTFTATCTCKPPDQSWVQALAQAETLLANTDRHDVTVTASMSDQMAKPTAAAPGPAAGKTKAGRGKPKPPPAPAVDPNATAEGLRASQAPTASNDSSGIGGPVKAARTIKEGDGPTIAVAGPDGAKKQIRLIQP